DHVLVIVAMASRRGQNECVGRSSQGIVGPVQLIAGRAAHHQAEVADDFVLAEAFEDKGGPLIEAAGLATIARGSIPALRCEADAAELLGGLPPVTPQSSKLARGAVIALARRRLPASCTGH